MKIIFLISLFGLLGCAVNSNKNSSGNTFSQDDINLDVHKMELSNGLRVLLLKNDKLPIFSYYTFYDVGSKHETKGITGASHYLEHMMFKGAKNFGQGKFDYIIEGNGGESNAYTTNDETVYYEMLPSKSLDLIIQVEADRMQNLLLEEEAFEKERNVVLEERKMRYENRPDGKQYLKMMESMFEGTPYGRSVIGDIQDLKTVTRDQMMEYFKIHYAPNNAVVVIVGSFDVSDIKSKINKAYGDIESSKNLKENKLKYQDSNLYAWKGKYNRELKINSTNPVPSFMYAFQGVKMGEREAYSMDILSSILGDGRSSYFHHLFVENKKPLLSSVNVSNYTLAHSGLFYVSGSLLSTTNLNSFKSSLQKEISKVCNEEVINLRNVQKVKNQYLVALYSGLDTNSGIARFIGNAEQDFGDYNYLKKELAIYNEIEASEIIDVCKKVFDFNKAIFSSVWSKHKE